MDNIARDYLNLAFAIDAYLPGYIDAYFGPEEIKQAAAARGKLPLEDLSQEAERLVAALPGAQFEPQRAEFFSAQLTAMQTSIRLLSGERLPLVQETEWIYGLTPAWVDENRFREAHRQLDELLPPGDSLPERMIAYRKAAEVSVETTAALMDELRHKLRARTHQLFDLPADEDFELVMVKNQPWGAYNWYLGKAHSRVEINTDLPKRVIDFLELLTHEGYPGHHTELSIKDVRLVAGRGWLEHSIALINAPSCSISEGLANCALDTVLTPEEQIAWEADLFARAGVKLDAARTHQLRQASRVLGHVSDNAAFLLREQGASQDETAAYIQRWALANPEQARKAVGFVSAYTSYVFNYSVGMDLLEQLFAVRGNRQAWFTRLLSEPVTTLMVRRWIEGGD